MHASSRVAIRWWKAIVMASVVAGLWLSLSGVAFAQRTEGDRAAAQGSYETEVPVRNQTEPERNRALARALLQVLSKATGDAAVGQRAGVRDELARAKDLVESFDYRQDEGVSAAGAPSFQTVMVVRFDQQEVDDLADMLGLPRWAQPRPKPVLWLAIDDGSGPRLVALAQYNAARSVIDRAKLRGYALGLPNGSAAEQAMVGAIWRGDAAAVAAMSRRYSPPMQLIGKLQRSAGGWKADWTFVDHGKVLSQWATTSTDARQAMAGGADGAADALFKRYAKAGSSGASGRYLVRVIGINSGDDYLRLMGYLERASVVRSIQLRQATAAGLELDVQLASGLANFTRYVGRSHVLLPVASEGVEAGAGASATFRMGGG